jgi:hypothetical protein
MWVLRDRTMQRISTPKAGNSERILSKWLPSITQLLNARKKELPSLPFSLYLFISFSLSFLLSKFSGILLKYKL